MYICGNTVFLADNNVIIVWSDRFGKVSAACPESEILHSGIIEPNRPHLAYSGVFLTPQHENAGFLNPE